MPVPRKQPQWSIRQDRSNKMNGLYVHASPPRVLSINSAHLKQILRSGDVERLEALVYNGQGKKLLTASSNDPKVKNLLQNLPVLMSKISLLHDAVNSGRLNELQTVLDEENEKTRRKLIVAKDDAGVGLLHKAIYYDLKPIAEWIIKTYPNAVQIKDAEGRTPYHYTPMGTNASGMQKLLKMAGADPSALDHRQRSVKYYKDHIAELELPSAHKSSLNSRRGTTVNEGLSVKKANIRIWIHQRDLNNLQHVIWEGHGSKLLVEHSNNAKVKRFLEACPYIMGCIKELHSDVINDDFEAFKEHSNPPVPNVLYIAKDCNGLTPLHKAVGLGRQEMVEYIIAHNPRSLSCVDNEGRTALHYSPILRDGGKMFDYLIEAGADEGALDNKSKSAGFYKMHTNEIDAKLLYVIPDSPRKAKEVNNFDWSILGVAATPLEEIAKAIGSSTEENNVEQVTENGSAEVNNNNNEEHSGEGETNEEEPEVDVVVEPIFGEEPPPAEPEPEPNPTPEPELELANPNEEETESEQKSTTPDPPPPPSPTVTPPPELVEERIASPVPAEEDIQPENEETPEEGSQIGDTPEESDRETAILEPEAVIEGVVNGENEIESVNEEGATKDEPNEEEVTAMVSSGNMEQLAALVLDGEGDRLMGQSSDVPELQSFLENVPVYMNKINRIHMAAREGNLKDLQAALDRRKFAVAKDKISATGTSPLHVATIFGNTSIVRYLAGRFPETASVSDDNGRTPLHYAAVVPDNGHYYNLLVHLGANTRTEDKFGHTPDFYRTNQGTFSHRSILAEFGAEELADEMLNDKESQGAHVEMPFFCTEEGRYLASSLGDPLIKGLTEVANQRPNDPIAYLAQYLANIANNNNTGRRSRSQEEGVGENQDMMNADISSTLQHDDENHSGETPHTNIDVVTLDPDSPQEIETAFSAASRDEHGQSMLHFAAARSHGRNALYELLVETNINIGLRDELYRTARDISIQASIPYNINDIDRYLMHIAMQGDTDKLVELLLDGYDHIIDISDEDGLSIHEAVNQADQPDTEAFLHSILAFEERRERVHHAIREGNLAEVKELLADANDTGSGRLLAMGKNSYSRCALHVAVLCQQEEIVDFLANTFRESLVVGDNLERTALHYAMGIEKIESISRVLIKAGAKRVAKDLKGRQPTYYFMNKSDILRLQEEEETF